jgi:LytS/YehU family sensor histidine kinase
MTDFRAHWPRWLAAYVAVIAVGTGALATSVAQYDLLHAFLAANVIVLLFLPAPVALVYGRQKYRTPRARRCFYGFMVLLVGALVYAYGSVWIQAGSITGLVPKTLNGIVLTVVVLAVATVAMFMDLAQEARREARLQTAQAQAELKLLQAQIEPHFLFNTLANLRHLVQTGSPDALAMLDHLVHYLRTALPDIRTPGSTVAREMELARAYLEIMRIRMGGALEFTIEVAPDAANTEMPPLMLMTLVENAVKHGIAPQAGGGWIRIQASIDLQGALVIVVRDSGLGFSKSNQTGVGLENVERRLELCYGGEARLAIESSASGTEVSVQIPWASAKPAEALR